MANSELPTRVSTGGRPAGRLRLSDAAVGRPLLVTDLDGGHRALLTPEGVDAGVELTVERRLALGGPLIVRLGRARLAIARNVAGGIGVVEIDAAASGGAGDVAASGGAGGGASHAAISDAAIDGAGGDAAEIEGSAR